FMESFPKNVALSTLESDTSNNTTITNMQDTCNIDHSQMDICNVVSNPMKNKCKFNHNSQRKHHSCSRPFIHNTRQKSPLDDDGIVDFINPLLKIYSPLSLITQTYGSEISCYYQMVLLKRVTAFFKKKIILKLMLNDRK